MISAFRDKMTPATSSNLEIPDVSSCNESRKSLSDLKSEILDQLPNAINAETCTKECLCQLNKSLLEYFVQIELNKQAGVSDSD